MPGATLYVHALPWASLDAGNTALAAGWPAAMGSDVTVLAFVPALQAEWLLHLVRVTPTAIGSVLWTATNGNVDLDGLLPLGWRSGQVVVLPEGWRAQRWEQLGIQRS